MMCWFFGFINIWRLWCCKWGPLFIQTHYIIAFANEEEFRGCWHCDKKKKRTEIRTKNCNTIHKRLWSIQTDAVIIYIMMHVYMGMRCVFIWVWWKWSKMIASKIVSSIFAFVFSFFTVFILRRRHHHHFFLLFFVVS